MTEDRSGSGDRGRTRPVHSLAAENLVLRQNKAPVDQLDFDDRHFTRATETDDAMKRYSSLYRERRRDERHQLAVSLVYFVVVVLVFLAGFTWLKHELPALTVAEALQVVGFACTAAGGGVLAGSVGRRLKRALASKKADSG